MRGSSPCLSIAQAASQVQQHLVGSISRDRYNRPRGILHAVPGGTEGEIEMKTKMFMLYFTLYCIGLLYYGVDVLIPRLSAVLEMYKSIQ